MAKQGYFSGKTEYNKQQKSGASGGYGKRTSGSDTRGYSKRKESEARGAYGSRQGDERNSYGKPADGAVCDELRYDARRGDRGA